jgi:predicted aminopeptidase
MQRRTRLTALAGLTIVVMLLMTPTGCYLSRAGWEEARILQRRRPIVDLVQDSAIDRVTRDKLRLVLEVRQFAIDSLRLAAKESFTTFSQLDSDTLVLVLSAAYRDRLEPFTWWFPIVGSVPYKGFFDFDAARREARRLSTRGFDVYLRPSAAFSTLGFFNDPLLSTTLREDSLDLANTVIHELTHNTFYAPGQADFNESFANFVGARGAARFFRARGREDAARLVEDRWSDEKLLAGFWGRLYRTLDSAFAAHANDRHARLLARDSIYHRARVALVFDIGPRLRTISPRYAERVRLDNAALLARRTYQTDLDLFDALLRRERELGGAIQRIVQLAREHPGTPFQALRAYLTQDSGQRPPATP